MASIVRVKLKWNGFAGAPGYSNFFYRDRASVAATATLANDAAMLVGNFASFVKTYMPIETSLQVQTDVERIEETTGQLEDVFTVATQPIQQGEALSAPYSAASGAVITWRTAGVRNGRRVRGRTFCVPLANTAYQSDGTIASSVLTALNTNLAGANFLGSTNSAMLCVYARPNDLAKTNGLAYECTGHTIPDKVAVLRSRRD